MTHTYDAVEDAYEQEEGRFPLVDRARVSVYIDWLHSRYRKPIHDWAARRHWSRCYRGIDWMKPNLRNTVKYWALERLMSWFDVPPEGQNLSNADKIAIGVELNIYTSGAWGYGYDRKAANLRRANRMARYG